MKRKAPLTEKEYLKTKFATRNGELVWAVDMWNARKGAVVKTNTVYAAGCAYTRQEVIDYLGEDKPLPAGRRMTREDYKNVFKPANQQPLPQASAATPATGGGLTTNQDGILMDAHHMIAELHGKVDSLTQDLDDLKASNDRLEAMMINFMGKFK